MRMWQLILLFPRFFFLDDSNDFCNAFTGLTSAIRQKTKKKKMRMVLVNRFWRRQLLNLARCSWMVVGDVVRSETFMLEADKSSLFW